MLSSLRRPLQRLKGATRFRCSNSFQMDHHWGGLETWVDYYCDHTLLSSATGDVARLVQEEAREQLNPTSRSDQPSRSQLAQTFVRLEKMFLMVPSPLPDFTESVNLEGLKIIHYHDNGEFDTAYYIRSW